MGRILNLENAIREIMQSIGLVQEKPILAAIYGYNDHGKSVLIDRLSEQLKGRWLETIGYAGAPDSSTFIRIKQQLQNNVEVYLFHCGWERFDSYTFEQNFGHEDPNILAGKILGRGVNINIFVYNPTMRPRGIPAQLGLYDFIISNPQSIKK